MAEVIRPDRGAAIEDWWEHRRSATVPTEPSAIAVDRSCGPGDDTTVRQEKR
ncbi:hypothetical protein ACVBEQ_19590 [Nakamurella sp. GG22]